MHQKEKAREFDAVASGVDFHSYISLLPNLGVTGRSDKAPKQLRVEEPPSLPEEERNAQTTRTITIHREKQTPFSDITSALFFRPLLYLNAVFFRAGGKFSALLDTRLRGGFLHSFLFLGLDCIATTSSTKSAALPDASWKYCSCHTLISVNTSQTRKIPVVLQNAKIGGFILDR